MAQLTFTQQILQSFKEIPVRQSTDAKIQELRKAHSLNQQVLKQANVHAKIKLQNSFWNQDITNIEMQTSKLLHEMAYFSKPDLFKQTPNFSHHYKQYLTHKGRINLTLEQQRQILMKHFEDSIARMWLRRRWLLRNRMKALHIPSVKPQDNSKPFHSLLNQEQFLQEAAEADPLHSVYETHGFRSTNNTTRARQLECIEVEITQLERSISEYDSLCDKLVNEKIYESQSHYDRVHVPQFQMSACDNLIFDKVNQKILESMPFLKAEHLRSYYDTVHDRHITSSHCTYVRIYLEAAQYRAQFESVFSPTTPSTPYDYMVPRSLKALQELLKEKAQHLGVMQDMTADGGALFLFAVDKQFKIGVEVQSTEYLSFLPYEIEVETQAAIPSHNNSTVKSPKASFQLYTIKMLKEMKAETLEKKQYRLRSAVHWLDEIHILPDQTANDLRTRLVFEQYSDTTIKSWMNFLLYHDTEKINIKLAKDVTVLQEKSATQEHVPDIYFQYYHRLLKILVLDSRRSLITILSVLNVFRTCQKNLNIYYMELNNLPHQLTRERVDKRSGMPMQSQQESFNAGFYNDGVFLTNPNQMQQGRTSRTNVEQTQRTDLFQKIESTSYSYEESISFEDGLFKVIDGQGFKVLNETALQDFFTLQGTLEHICSFILHYSLKHGFEDEGIIQQEQQQQYLTHLNREKVVQEVLAFEAQWLSHKCRILQLIQPLLSHCGPELLYNAICKLTRLMSLRPNFELRNTVFLRYHQNCELMAMVAMIADQLTTQQQDPQSLLKLLLFILDVAFPDEEAAEFTYEQRKLALLDVYHNQICLLGNSDTFIQQLPLPAEYQHFFNDLILDSKNNFDVVAHHIISQAEKGQLESYNCNIFSLLEFQKFRRRTAKTLLRMLWSIEIFQRQVRGMGRNYVKQFAEDQQQQRIVSPQPKSSARHSASLKSEGPDISMDYQSSLDVSGMLTQLLEEGIPIGREMNKLESWAGYAADTIKMLDMTLPLNSLLLLNAFCFNAIQLNNHMFAHVMAQMPRPSDDDAATMMTQLLFVNPLAEKIRISNAAMTNTTRKKKEDGEATRELSPVQPTPPQQILKQASILLGLNKQNSSGPLSKTMVNTFLHKLQGHSSNATQEFNLLTHKWCIVTAQTIIALQERRYLIDLNAKLPFTTPLFSHKEEVVEPADRNLNEQHHHDDESNGMLDSKGYLCDPFVIPSLRFLFKCMKRSIESETAESVETTAYIDAFQYNPGGEEWAKFQKFKMETGTTPLTPNKKLTKFRSAGYPYTGHVDVEVQPCLFLISSNMQVCIQLISLLLASFAPQCNRVDLVFLHDGLLGEPSDGYYKRHQLRLRRDLMRLVEVVQSLKKNILVIVANPNILKPTEAVLKYLTKFTNRVYVTQLLTAMTAINQFRHNADPSHKVQHDEGYVGLIAHLKRLLIQLQFRNVGHLEKLANETPQVLKTMSKQHHYSPLMILLKHVLGTGSQNLKWNGAFNQVVELAYIAQHRIEVRGMSTPSTTTPKHRRTCCPLSNLKSCPTIQFNNNHILIQVSYFLHVTKHLSTCFSSLFHQFPQSKLIYYSTVQDMLQSETEEILRNRFIFEAQDVFAYERAYTKIIMIQYRYLVLAEHVLMHKYKVLPFESLPQLQTQDPLEELISTTKRSIEEQNSKQIKKQVVPRLSQTLARAIKLDHESTHKRTSHKSSSTKSSILKTEQQTTNYVILDKLRIESFATCTQKLAILMIACHNIIMQEGVEYLQGSIQNLAQCTNQLRLVQGQQSLTPLNLGIEMASLQNTTRYSLGLKLSTFLGNFERDSLMIQTLNKGEAHVIANQDLEQHLSYLQSSILSHYDEGVLGRMHEITSEKDEIIKMFNIKGLENEFLHKKIRFYESHIGHIVESMVAQRTNNLILENEGLKLDLQRMQCQLDMQSYKLRDELKTEFKDNIQDQATNFQVLQNRFADYKRGINMELVNFIDAYKQDGLRKIKDQTVTALKDGQNAFYSSTEVVELAPTQMEATEDVQERFTENNKQMIQLFGSLKKLRLFYQMREGTMRSKFESQIADIKVANQSNEQLLSQIAELCDKLELLKDEVAHNKRIMSVMDNQNQILRRDLQKVKVDRMTTLKERGISQTANYQQKLEQSHDDVSEQPSSRHNDPVIERNLMSIPSRPMTALSSKRSAQNFSKVRLESSAISIPKSQSQKNQIISVKYRIQKKS